MLKYLVWIIFLLSVALAAGSIVLAAKLRRKNSSDIFSSILYYLVFIFTFGFYGIWGQVIIESFLSPYLESAVIERFTNISLLLGLPFLVFAWLMLIRFAAEINGRIYNNWHLVFFLIVNFLVIITLGWLIIKENLVEPAVMLRYYFVGMTLFYSTASSLHILFPKKGRNIVHSWDRRVLAAGIFLAMFLQLVPLVLFDISVYIQLAFVILFFAGNSFLPVWFSYGTLMSPVTEGPCRDKSFEAFCLKFDVSPRETDIIREICNGLSNKEIADRLFISLQTVKDHTHRIYIKTNVKSRVQLINLVKEEVSPKAP